LVTAAIRFALVGVARNVATPVPKPDTPLAIGRPVALVRVPEEGVPRAPPDVSKVEDVGIVVELTVKPSTFDIVVADVTTVVPRVGAE
jgi:hypothetical protein